MCSPTARSGTPEYAFGLLVAALAKDNPDGSPSPALSETVDALLEASIPEKHKAASNSLAVDWTDAQCWAAAPHSDGVTADP
ncbi:MAG: hypothetical protein ACYC1D_05330 [Acidimicrobiales bacterium]